MKVSKGYIHSKIASILMIQKVIQGINICESNGSSPHISICNTTVLCVIIKWYMLIGVQFNNSPKYNFEPESHLISIMCVYVCV